MIIKKAILSYKATTQSLLASKGRSFLTILGIVIGVAAVIIIMSIGSGAQSLILSQVESLGSNLIGIAPGKTDNGAPASLMGITITTLVYDDVVALKNKRNVPNLVDLVAYTKGIGTISWGSEKYDTNLSGCTSGYPVVEGGEVELGRFFTSDEEKNLSKVMVLGSTVRNELFGETDPIGRRVKLKNHSFEVIGVMKERGTVAFQDYDDQVFIPLLTMQKLISGVHHLGLIRGKIDNEQNIQIAIHDIEATLREQHDIRDQSGDSDDFMVLNAAEALNVIKSVTNGLNYFLGAMAALSLLVGGIGIMNIMLISVTERTREIGLRKAIGANNLNIKNQFLLESVLITLLGGIIGILIGIFISFVISLSVNALGYKWKFLIPTSGLILSIGVSTFIGVIFGLYPAIKASKLNPIEALRYE